jgi:hypothetical protein
MACIANDPENPSSWLRWHRASDVSLPLADCLSLCNDNAPAGAILYDYQADDLPTYLPAVNGDVFKFFFNGVNPLALSGYLLAVGLLNRGRPISSGFTSSVSVLNYGTGTSTRQRFYGSLTFVGLRDDWYTPYLYDLAHPDKILYLANAVKVVNRSRWQRETCFARFRHNGPLSGVDYQLLPEDYYQQFRIPFALHEPTYPETIETYTDRNGSTRTTEEGIQLVYSLSSDFITQLDFQAGVLMLAHHEIYLNDKLVRKTAALEVVEYFEDVNALTVKGKVEDANFAQILSSC